MFKNPVDWEGEALAEPQTRIQRPAQQKLRPPQSCRHKILTNPWLLVVEG